MIKADSQDSSRVLLENCYNKKKKILLLINENGTMYNVAYNCKSHVEGKWKNCGKKGSTQLTNEL